MQNATKKWAVLAGKALAHKVNGCLYGWLKLTVLEYWNYTFWKLKFDVVCLAIISPGFLSPHGFNDMAAEFHCRPTILNEPIIFTSASKSIFQCLKERHHVLRNRSNVRSNVESRTSDEDDCGYSTESDNTFDKTETLV